MNSDAGGKGGEIGEEGTTVTGTGGRVLVWKSIREGRTSGVFCSRLVHSYSFVLHISDKHWAFRIVLCEKMKKRNKS